MGYRIKTVARMTGVPRNTLLAWERRYALVSPERADNGYREYTEGDVARIAAIKRLVDRGYKVSEAISLVDEGQGEAPLASAAGLAASSMGLLDEVQQQLCAALLRFDRGGALGLLEQLPLMGFQAMVDQLYLPTLAEIGDLWEDGEISVAQEHFASAFCRERLLAMLVSLGHGPEGGALHLVGGVAGERHEGGLLALSIRLALRGKLVVYLGPDVPLDALLQAVALRPPVAVCLSATGPHAPEPLLAYLQAARAGVPAGVRIAVGGGAMRRLRLPSVEGVEYHVLLDTFFGEVAEEAAR